MERSAIESVNQEMAANQGKLEPEVFFLALSGGGGDGAFGAGICAAGPKQAPGRVLS